MCWCLKVYRINCIHKLFHACFFLISKAVLQLIYYDFDNFALFILNAYKYFKIIILRYRNG